MDSGIATRLKQVRESVGETQKSMSSRLGLGPSTWQKIELGVNLPSGETLLKVAELGFNTNWILTGEGQMRLQASEHSEPTPFEPASNRAPNAADPELLARINDTINRIYREESGRISPADMGRLAAGHYADIMSATNDPAERAAMVKLMEVQLRQEVRKMATGNSKASA